MKQGEQRVGVFAGISRIRGWMRNIRTELSAVRAAVDDAKILAANALMDKLDPASATTNIQNAEFKVFSQFGEDGIIQYLIRLVKVPRNHQSFVELGVADYSEANTRFLLINDNWRGLIIDGSEDYMAAVRSSTLYWKHDLTARSAFIDRDNINGLISDAGFNGEIGLLSIDLDGNDYWVWERISVVDPMIVVAEYNGLFGATRAVVIPYYAAFDRTRAHYSSLYWGCSLRALQKLAEQKGYALVGSNRAGVNAFFVKRNHLNGQVEVDSAGAFCDPRHRDSRDRTGKLNYLSGRARLEEIADMPLFDLELNRMVRVKDIMREA